MLVLTLVAQTSPPAAAIVESLEGTASLQEPGDGARKAVQLYGWPSTNSALSVGPRSSVILLFRNGSRWRFGANSTATLGAEGPSKSSGDVKLLGSVPSLPRVLPMAGRAPGRAAAVRLRTGPQIRDMYPFSGASSLADSTSLHFSEIDGVSSYRIEIVDDQSTPVFDIETKTNSVTVPPGRLQPGTHYRWRVRGTVAAGTSPSGEAVFETLSAEDVARRAALHSVLRTGDATSLTLLAEIDIASGLYAEALNTLKSAAAVRPNDPVIRNELARLEELLKEKP